MVWHDMFDKYEILCFIIIVYYVPGSVFIPSVLIHDFTKLFMDLKLGLRVITQFIKFIAHILQNF